MIKITEMPVVIYSLLVKVIVNVLALVLYIPFYNPTPIKKSKLNLLYEW